MKRVQAALRALAAGIATATLTLPAWTSAQAQQPAQAGGVALREVDIRVFIADVSAATGRTFIVDPRVQGQVTVLAQQPLDQNELFDVFQTTLRVHGYVAIPTAQGAWRIVPDEVAAREPAPTQSASAGNRYVTQVFRLEFADAEAVATALRPLLSERGQATANRRGNTLIVVDYGSTVTRVGQVIERLDADTTQFRSIRLNNVSAAEMARLAQSMATAVGEDAGARTLLQATPVASSNTLVLRGDPRLLDRIVPVITELDANAQIDSAVQVIPLRYANAEELAPVLQSISASLTAQEPNNGAAPQAGRTANIAAHAATNSLIINASPELQETLARVVRSLDVRREQILVEAIIVEVSDTAAEELGLQFLVSGDGENAVPFLSTSYANTAPNLLAATGALLIREGDEDSESLRDLRQAAVRSLLGVSGFVGGVGGQTEDGQLLGLILRALAEDRESNVLSTPSVMTLDNESASLLVGQQIPITTGEALSGNNDNPFRTVQRQDVGVSLQVRPQISGDGAIRLEIVQEVSSIFGPVIADSTDLITNRRVITTVVQADPGEIIVLGGLIQEEVIRTESGVPGLRNIPLAGRLFRSEGQERRRTNLMVFLRPTIVNTSEQARAVTARQFDSLRLYPGLDPALLGRLEAEFRTGAAIGASMPLVDEAAPAEAPLNAVGGWSAPATEPGANTAPATSIPQRP
jgi:general secretion pathway protein D